MTASRRHRRVRTAAATVAVALALAAAGWVAVGIGTRGNAPAAADAGDRLPPQTDTVRRQNLADTESVTGTLGYGREWSLAGRDAGTVTWVPEVGAVVGRGKPLVKVDDDPVLLLLGSMPAYRDLAPGAEGTDVKQFEENLSKLGYDGFTVDDEYTSATASAVREWQEDLGLAETGRVELGRVVFAPADVRVSAASVAAGDPVSPGNVLLTYTGTARVITVDLDIEDQRLAVEDAEVAVSMPDGRELNGKIDSVATVIEESDEPNGDPTTAIEVEVTLAERVEGYAAASVDVEFTTGVREDVLTVPVSALLALAEGGYGLEVVDGGTSRVVAVDTGLFAAGRVEVSGGGITDGTVVGIPA